MNDLISRQAAIDSFWELDVEIRPSAINAIIDMIRTLPPAETPKRTGKSAQNVPNNDLISRKAAIEAVDATWWNARGIRKTIQELPSAQSERTCVNCGRTVNNGGWYADGRTRCPIEEHYALPKDGYCHLWEKRNVTDDDYQERRTDT